MWTLSELTTGGKEAITNGGTHKAIEVSLVGAVGRIEDLLDALWVVDIEKAIGAHPGDEGCLILVRQIVHILKKCWIKCKNNTQCIIPAWGRPTYFVDSSSAGPCQWRANPLDPVAARQPRKIVCGSIESRSIRSAASWSVWCRSACRWTTRNASKSKIYSRFCLTVEVILKPERTRHLRQSIEYCIRTLMRHCPCPPRAELRC